LLSAKNINREIDILSTAQNRPRASGGGAADRPVRTVRTIRGRPVLEVGSYQLGEIAGYNLVQKPTRL